MKILPADIFAHLRVHDPLRNLLVLSLNLLLPDGPPSPIGPDSLLTNITEQALAGQIMGNSLLNLIPSGDHIFTVPKMYFLPDMTMHIS